MENVGVKDTSTARPSATTRRTVEGLPKRRSAKVPVAYASDEICQEAGAAVSATAARVAILVDTPNIGIATRNQYGWLARPDFRTILALANTLGTVETATAFVNAGVDVRFAEALARIGFSVESDCSHHDVDPVLIRTARTLRVDRLVLCAGDGDYLPVVNQLRATGTMVIVIAVPAACSTRLRAAADIVLPMPLLAQSGSSSIGPEQTWA